MKANTNKPTKTQVFNVIILDRSGSMNSIRTAAIDGFNVCDGMGKDLSSRMNLFGRLAGFKREEQHACCPIPDEERNARYSAMADAAFDEEI